jgi:adenylate kinase
MFKVIYLTGAPASGKTSICAFIKHNQKDFLLFEYGFELTKHINNRVKTKINQKIIRTESGNLVTPKDVSLIDKKLLRFVESNRNKKHIIIDTHAVTKENYGFRITPFSYNDITKLSPTDIFVLFADSNVVKERIKKHSMGRHLTSLFGFTMHNNLQASVAINYGMILGIPIYFFDSNKPIKELYDNILDRILK